MKSDRNKIRAKAIDKTTKYAMVSLGSALYALSIIYFVTPQNLYTGGVMGFAQLIRTFLVETVGFEWFSNYDIAGIVYYIVNIPLLVMAFRDIGGPFFLRTLVATTMMTILMSVIPESKPLVENTLASCVVGGIVSGAGVGMMLRHGGSGGGLDILGVWLTKKYSGFSVGKVAMAINVILYSICAFAFGFEVAIYSVIFTAVSSVTLDRFHYQNIMIEAMIFTKKEGIPEAIMTTFGRGVTEWNGEGAYTHDHEYILVTVISKYEMNSLRHVIRKIDPNAFITYSRIDAVDGNFLRKL